MVLLIGQRKFAVGVWGLLFFEEPAEATELPQLPPAPLSVSLPNLVPSPLGSH